MESEGAPSTAGTALPAPGAFDGHTHLDIMERPVPAVLEAAAAMGINRVITVGTDLESSRWSVECASLHDRVFAAVAIHPNDVSGLDMVSVAGEIEGEKIHGALRQFHLRERVHHGQQRVKITHVAAAGAAEQVSRGHVCQQCHVHRTPVFYRKVQRAL